jgi:hypothetical protein
MKLKTNAAPYVLTFLLLGSPVLLPATAGPAAADDSGFRCESGRLVSRGDHMAEVRHKCGDPQFVIQRTEKRRVKHKIVRWVAGAAEEVSEEREVEVPIDEWTYDLGPERFIRFVAFEDGRVIGVRTGGYGTKKRE